MDASTASLACDVSQVAGDLLLEGECPARTRNTLLRKIK